MYCFTEVLANPTEKNQVGENADIQARKNDMDKSMNDADSTRPLFI